MASENQSINKRSTRLQTAMEKTISTVPETAEPDRTEEFVQMQGRKRKADLNLAKQGDGAKRFALGNLTNAESENVQIQKLQTEPIPTAKEKQSSDSKMCGTKQKGVAKMLTRAAMRLARNVKQQQSTQVCSSLSNDFAKINIDVGTVPKPETAHIAITYGTSGKETSQLCSTNNQQTHQYELDVLCEEIKAKSLERFNAKPRTRLSNDFELSDNSLYVTAIENQDEESNSTASISSGEREKSESSTKHQTLQSQHKTEKEPGKLEAPMMSKHLIRGISDNDEQEKSVDEKKNIQMKKETSGAFESSNDSLYVSAIDSLEGSLLSVQLNALPIAEQENRMSNTQVKTEHKEQQEKNSVLLSFSAGSALNNSNDGTESTQSPLKRTPPGVEDFDKLFWHDITQVSEYAQDIFEYLRQRESAYAIKDYMDSQPNLSRYMRALVIDWMIEIQESFELNHETLYLGVKILDVYLSKVVINRATLQLVAATALLIAAKYDERVPPTVDDFIFICDYVYERRQLLKMERSVFRTIGYDLGFPLSYRFLRRYARVIRTPMPILTLARYILETSLMEYATVVLEDSKLACAALFIARRMFKLPGWNEALEYYSGYKVNDFKNEAIMLNNGIWPRKSPIFKLNNVRDKYAHEVFFKVSKIPVIYVINELFANTDAVFKIPTAYIAAKSAKPTRAKNDAS